MRYAFIVSALAGLAAAVPMPQEMDFEDVVADAPPPTQTAPAAGAPDVVVPFSSASASAAAVEAIKSDPLKLMKAKRGVNDACAPQPSSANPPAGDNSTPQSFVNDPNYSATASGAPTPAGYTRKFVNLKASINQDAFLRLKTLDTYDTAACAALCDSTNKCLAFDLYLERDPSLAPADGCTNPAPATNVKCTLYGLPISALTATNDGQYRRDFQVVITASNGYVKNYSPGPIDGYCNPQFLDNAAINAPSGTQTYLGYKSFKGPYDPAQCAIACDAQTAYNSRHPAPDGTYKSCTFFNSYILLKNDAVSTTQCSLYTTSYDPSYATNVGQTRGNDKYTITDSVTYSKC